MASPSFSADLFGNIASNRVDRGEFHDTDFGNPHSPRSAGRHGRCRGSRPDAWRCGGRHRRKRSHHALPRSLQRPRPCRSASPRRGDPVAGQGNGFGPHARRPARDHQEARRPLGEALRLAQDRSEAQLLPAVRHQHRRAGHPFHPCSLEAKKRAADHHHPRLAGLDHRAAEDHRAADRSDRPWRQRRGRVRRRDPVAARLWLLGQADRGGLESTAHRQGLGRR